MAEEQNNFLLACLRVLLLEPAEARKKLVARITRRAQEIVQRKRLVQHALAFRRQPADG